MAAVHAMLVYAWAQHYGYRGPSLWSDTALPIVDQTMRSACVYSATGATPIKSLLGTTMSGIFSPGFLAAYRSGVWGDYRAFGEYFRENRIGPYDQTAPLKIYQGSADPIVPEPATRQVVDALRAGGVEVDYEVVPGGGHGNVAFGFVAYAELRTDASIQWLRRHLDASP